MEHRKEPKRREKREDDAGPRPSRHSRRGAASQQQFSVTMDEEEFPSMSALSIRDESVSRMVQPPGQPIPFNGPIDTAQTVTQDVRSPRGMPGPSLPSLDFQYTGYSPGQSAPWPVPYDMEYPDEFAGGFNRLQQGLPPYYTTTGPSNQESPWVLSPDPGRGGACCANGCFFPCPCQRTCSYHFAEGHQSNYYPIAGDDLHYYRGPTLPLGSGLGPGPGPGPSPGLILGGAYDKPQDHDSERDHDSRDTPASTTRIPAKSKGKDRTSKLVYRDPPKARPSDKHRSRRSHAGDDTASGAQSIGFYADTLAGETVPLRALVDPAYDGVPLLSTRVAPVLRAALIRPFDAKHPASVTLPTARQTVAVSGTVDLQYSLPEGSNSLVPLRQDMGLFDGPLAGEYDAVLTPSVLELVPSLNACAIEEAGKPTPQQRQENREMRSEQSSRKTQRTAKAQERKQKDQAAKRDSGGSLVERPRPGPSSEQPEPGRPRRTDSELAREESRRKTEDTKGKSGSGSGSHKKKHTGK